MQMFVVQAVIVFHWLHLIVGFYDYECEDDKNALTTPSNRTHLNVTHLNVSCSDRHVDIRTVDNPCLHPNTTRLPPIQQLWTECRQLQGAPNVTRTMELQITLTDHNITQIPDEYFCKFTIERVIILGNSSNDTTKVEFSSDENCTEQCETDVQTLFWNSTIDQVTISGNSSNDTYENCTEQCSTDVQTLGAEPTKSTKLQVIIFGNSLNDTRKLGFSSDESCTACLTDVQTLRAERTNFTKIFNDSFCGLGTLLELHLSDCRIRTLETDAFIHLRSLQTLDLKSNNISTLPNGVFVNQQNTLLHLDMSNNQLQSKSTMELKDLTQLLHLDMSNNRLDGRSMWQIKNLTQLEFLNLEGNRIDFLPRGIFDELGQLRHLNMGKNLLKHLHKELRFLTNLESLDVNTNRISVILLGFIRLPKLKIINIQNNPIVVEDIQTYSRFLNATHVNFSNITRPDIPRFLSRARKIKKIYLSNKSIDRIRVGAFNAGEDIDLIDLSHNRLTDITNKFRNCTVKHLILDHNKITKFSFNDFSSKLTVLSMTHNHIHYINVATVDNRWSLTSLNLSNNLFGQLKNLSLPTSLANFDVRNNNITYISYSDNYVKLSLSNQTLLSYVHLENNSFKVICPNFIQPKYQPLKYYFNENPLLCTCENRWLLSMDFRDTVVEDRTKLTCEYEFKRFGNQHKFIRHLNNPDIYCSFNHDCECGINRVACNVECPRKCQCHKRMQSNHVYMDCSSKHVELPLTSTKLNKTRGLYVYLDDNSIYKIGVSSFRGLNNTIELYLNWTGLTEMEDGSFDHLTMLSVLQLDHNNLRHISENIFKNISSLTQLFLSHNQIQTVASNAFPSQLQTLYLDNNQLVDYGVWQLDDLPNLKSVSVHANEWSCEWNFTEKFRSWLQNNSRLVDKSEELDCVQTFVTQFQIPPNTTETPYFCNTTAENGAEIRYSNIWKCVIGIYLFVKMLMDAHL